MLQSHHSLVVKALQMLYKHCVNKEGFPGEPLVEAVGGYPLTHAILDRLGLIKEAEESPDDEPDEDPDGPWQGQCDSSTQWDSTTTTTTMEQTPEPAFLKSEVVFDSSPGQAPSYDNR